ncbi:MAG: LPS-assembly protein LptD [Selenomonas sp.]|uniref:LPS-assembly protein LptD n=1 Tax=Selenomonas sp. TaxID=2053611 RepID=UPI0025F49C26|nr:LPS-assembly protein LptD [Selenomonas sp.]MCR5757321.1 LPS-assembly protein LptD [Selenomonas sp.]
MNRHKLAGLLAAAVMLPLPSGVALAAYHSDSDTGVSVLDYIEDRHRSERENRLSDEQKKLLEDAKALENSLRYPLDKTKAMPVAFEGDDLTYDERDGSFIAKGHVDIVQMDAHRFQGEEVTGNTKSQDVYVPDKAHVLQLTPGQSRVTLDGYKAHYNYGKSTGEMDNIKGKVGNQYVTGKRIEFYPDRIVIYEGTQTKCGAKNPDYQLKAKKITVYPNDKTVMENVKFCIRGKTIYSRKYYEQKANESGVQHFPRVGYDNDDGVWVEWDFSQPLAKHVAANANLHVTSKDGWRSNYNVTWSNAGMRTGVTYGYFEDSDSNWIKKQPSAFWSYGHKIGDTHLNYGLSAEYGRWYNKGIHSNHGKYSISLSRDAIRFHRFALHLSTGYSVTTESYDDSRVNGWSWSALLTKDFDERWAAYAGYYYSQSNKMNSLFNYDTADTARRIDCGFSYRLDSKNRFVVGSRYDLEAKKWSKVDYYWYHDFHCTQVILRYRSKENQWNIRWQFTPW